MEKGEEECTHKPVTRVRLLWMWVPVSNSESWKQILGDVAADKCYNQSVCLTVIPTNPSVSSWLLSFTRPSVSSKVLLLSSRSMLKSPFRDTSVSNHRQ